MGAAVQLQIGTAPFTFDVEGAYFPRLEAVYKEAANPRQVVALRETWEFRGCKILSADDTVASTWTKWLAFRASVASRTAHPTLARLVRDPAGAAATLVTLGPSTHEQFMIEVVEGETDELAPEASWRKVATCTLRVTAVLKNPEAVTGLVEWEQEVEVTYEDGRQGVEARTRITTAEGTSAVTKAQTYARLTASSFGANFLYETNGPDGIEYTVLDDDRPNSRVPTIVEAVSRIRGYGISFGTVTAGSAPSSVSYSVTTRRTTDDDGAIETQVVTRAEARGPGAAAFVSSRRPSVYTDYEEFEDAALDLATGTWTERRNTSGQKKPRFKVTITGGRAAEWEASMSGPPIYFHGGQGAYTATVDVIREFTGTTAALDSLKLPGPPEGWTVHQDESQEDDPELVQEGATAAQNKWRRTIRLVFRCGVLPTTPVTELLRAAPEVDSYFYGVPA